jgi:hypothetical protein
LPVLRATSTNAQEPSSDFSDSLVTEFYEVEPSGKGAP